MQCPKCGYEMGPFDVECERCKRMAQQQTKRPSLPAAPTQYPPVSYHLPEQQAPYHPSVPQSRPQPIVVSHGLAWTAACCPLFVVLVEIVLAAVGIESGWVVLGVMLVINGMILQGDEKYLSDLGFDTSPLKNAWLIPAYLFSRPSVVGGGNGYGILWCVLFVLSMVPVG